MRKSDANEERALEVKLREKTLCLCTEAVQTSEQRVALRALQYSADLLFARPFCSFVLLFNVTASYMWRSNVLRLRKYSSAAAWRNTRWYSSQTSLPITGEEFRQALEPLWSRALLLDGNGNLPARKLGE
jgi:hypothetical protein